jgi:hypothetical protein
VSISASDRHRAHSLPAATHSLRIVDEKPKENSAAEEEAELRRVVQALFEQEENLLNFHMSSKIQVSAYHSLIPLLHWLLSLTPHHSILPLGECRAVDGRRQDFAESSV